VNYTFEGWINKLFLLGWWGKLLVCLLWWRGRQV
jgi:hypothetical protein